MTIPKLDTKLSAMLNNISAARLEDEDICISQLMQKAKNISYNHAEAATIATHYIETFRKNTGNIGLEEFFRQYGLETNEGLAVMSLAEALLRISDAETANEFIHDKLGNAAWSQSGQSSSTLVKASSLGLKLAAKLVECRKAISSITDPVVRESIKQSMKLVGDHFVMGETPTKALQKGKEYETEGYVLSYDMLGESARTEAQAAQYMQNYLQGVAEVAASADTSLVLYKRPGISVKLSALYPKYTLTNKDLALEALIPRVKEIALQAKNAGISITIDAEESSRLDISLEIFSHLICDKEFASYDGLGIAVQAYNKSAIHVIDFIIKLANDNNCCIPIRLVKGAYWDSEIKAAQIAGVDVYPVFTHKEYSDISYMVCASKMLENIEVIYPQFATHNALTIATIEVMAKGKKDYEFQRLYGMGAGIYAQIIGRIPCRIYAPVGEYKDLLPYLIRRILENGASASFLKKVIDSKVSVIDLVENPIEIITNRAETNSYHIPLPYNLYGSDRKNSHGFDLGNRLHILEIEKGIEQFRHHIWNAAPIINGKYISGTGIEISAPYNTNLKIGDVVDSSQNDIKSALNASANAFASWSNTSVDYRTKIIEKFADLLEKNRFEIIALCNMEAGKTIPDSIAELREAVDFCRYYAARAREKFATPKILHGPTGEQNELSYHGRGVFLCISPWNFPLAIFTGQIVAALLAGNSVIAKPAEQTPLIASLAIKLLLKSGLPKGVISLLPGDGATIGKYLIDDKRISGVVFTGSFETAEIIGKSLAMRGGAIVPFIAETGGLNTMIVDSSALIEQAVDDILISAFGSSGQRCSALRVLYVQEDIADNLILILQGAMASLRIGLPDNISTDIGPVIDINAYNMLNSYIGKASEKYELIAETSLPHDLNKHEGYFIAPIAFEVNSIKDLPGEIFGPVLHIIRYKAKDIGRIIDDINSCGYGLTLGVQSRIDSRIKYIRNNANVGNIYVNRSMIGATVGVQPFGGEGLSGTGPKAGGPNYLMRFATERSFTENTAAIGGNRDLLSRP